MKRKKEPSDIQKIKSFSEELVLKSKGALVCPKAVMDRIQILAPEAVTTLEGLMLHSKADSVRLKAALEILGLAGISKENRITITTNVEELDDSSLNTRLSQLLSKAGSIVIDGQARDITPQTTEIH